MITLALFAGLAFACGRPTGEAPTMFQDETAVGSVVVPTMEATVTHQIPDQVVLSVGPEDEDQLLAELALPVLNSLAENEGMVVTTTSDLTEADIEEGTRIIVLIGGEEEAERLIPMYPDQTFLVIGETELSASDNVSLIGAKGLPYKQQAFMAGYVAATLSPEWRTGMVVTNTSESITGYYTRGIEFFCGLCRIEIPPYYEYPIIEFSDPTSTSDLNQTLQSLGSFAVDVAFIPGELSSLDDGSIQSLIIGTVAPDDEWTPWWVATIEFDVEDSIREAWPQLLGGVGGETMPIGLRFSNVNELNFSPGKLEHTNLVLEDIISGSIGVEAIR